MKAEYIEFDGVKYYRYPESKHKKHRNYFKDSKANPLHRVIWEYFNARIPDKHHIHHKDGNSLNNDISNLECLTPAQHFKAHSILSKSDPTKDIYEPQRIWQRSEEGKKHHSILGKKNNQKRRDEMKFTCICCDQKVSKENIYCRKHEYKKRKRIYRRKNKPTISKNKFIPIEKKCIACDQKILQCTKIEKIYCSKACKSKHRNKCKKDYVEKKCVICDSEYMINKYSKTITCSHSCRNLLISFRLKNREA